jgi:tetratricopeptide (TPR) repeat protein
VISEGDRDPATTLRNELSGFVRGNVIQAASVGQVTLAATEPDYPIPFQVPPPPRSFSSRQEELAELERWFAHSGDQPVLAVICGPGGVGKTSLAFQYLYDNRANFPDGQLYVNLGAFSDHGPVAPEQALEWFLVALGLPTDRVPVGLPQREALYRSVTADRALAILLDNAVSAAQIRPLLPSSPRSVALVTSRWRLSALGLDGARFVEVDPLDITESVELLANVIGEARMAAEQDHARELARLCGGMPIALSVVGARLSARPNRTVSREVIDLRGKDRLTVLSLSNDELSVRSVFDLSYEALAPEQARCYRLCALHPGTSFGMEVAAVMSDRTADEAGLVLDDLVELNLLSEIDDRRFSYHDLLREHARQAAEQVDDEPSRDAAERRMVEWYLDTTVAAELILRPTRKRVGTRFQRPPDRSDLMRTHDDAVRWLTVERTNVIEATRSAMRHGWHDLVWEMCEALWGFMPYSRNDGEWLELFRAGVSAAHHCANPAAEARLRTQLASTLAGVRRYEDALQESLHAVCLADQAGNVSMRAAAYTEAGAAARGTGDLLGALDYLDRARRIRQEFGPPRSLTQCRRQIGAVLTDLGRYEEAVGELRAAAEAVPDLDIEQARVLARLGDAYLRWGHLPEAEAPLRQAFEIARQLGAIVYQADALAMLGELAERTGDVDRAHDHFSVAHRIYTDCGDPRAEDLAARLGGTST